jgi:hypothetical protein
LATDGTEHPVRALLFICFKMATVQEKAHFMEWFIETKSITQVQQNFRRLCGRQDVPSRHDIKDWMMDS